MEKTNLKQELENLELYAPNDLEMESDGYGEFPDSFKLTPEAVEKLYTLFIQFKNVED